MLKLTILLICSLYTGTKNVKRDQSTISLSLFT